MVQQILLQNCQIVVIQTCKLNINNVTVQPYRTAAITVQSMHTFKDMPLQQAWVLNSNLPPLGLSISVFPLASSFQTPGTHLGCRFAARPDPPNQNPSQTRVSVSGLGTLHSLN